MILKMVYNKGGTPSASIPLWGTKKRDLPSRSLGFGVDYDQVVVVAAVLASAMTQSMASMTPRASRVCLGLGISSR